MGNNGNQEFNLEEALDTVNEAVFILDLKGIILYCNSAVKKLYGYENDALLGRSVSVMLPPARSSEFESVRDTLLLGVTVDPFDTERLSNAGNVIKVSSSFSLVKSIEGKITGIACVERKVTVYDTIGNKAQALLETAPDAMVIVNGHGQIILINNQTEKLFGYPKEELLGQDVELLIPERFMMHHVVHRNKFFKAPKTRSMGLGLELYGKRKDNSEFPIEISLSPLSTEDGVFVSAAIRDITERKKAERKFRDLLESAPDAMIILDKDGAIKLVNAQVEKLFGYERKDLYERKIDILLPSGAIKEKQDHESFLTSALNGGMVKGLEVIALKKNKEEIPVEISLSPIDTEEGMLVSAVIRDIRERKNAELMFKKLLEAAPDAMVIVNTSGIIQLVNVQAEKMFGYRREEMKGKPVEILLPDRYLHSHDKHRNSFFNSPKVRPMGEGRELFGKRKDGQEFPVEISLSPLETDEGILVSAAIRDISERRYIRDLENKNRELEQFAYIASHDLQEPLDTVSSFILLLQENHTDKMDQEAVNYIEYIKNSSERLRLLITGLLEYSRLGKKSRREKVDCNILLREMLEDIDLSLKTSKTRIHCDNLPTLNAYPVELRLLFQNLISNSIKFSKENVSPEITIRCKEKERHYEFCVSDNGIGIDSRYKDKVFIIFQRLHSDRVYKGSGIGLAHCKKIVELHDGKIWLESIPEKGTDFYFTIPVDK